MIEKLEHYGIRGNAKKLLESYLIGRQQYTAINGLNSEWMQVIYGVPQGSVLGPLLFLIYINDLKNCYNEIGCDFILYADDTNIFVVGSTKEDAYRKANSILKEAFGNASFTIPSTSITSFFVLAIFLFLCNYFIT